MIYRFPIVALLALIISQGVSAQTHNIKVNEERQEVIVNIVYEEKQKVEPNHFYLKTNLVGIGMLIANVAAEYEFGKYWSVNLPIYYSGWNYFRSSWKYRTFAVQPELRFHPSVKKCFFIGAHAGLAYFNYALGGDYRYQDYNQDTPAIGGGLNIGYKLPFGENNRWGVEFSVGGGVYATKYDKYRNVNNGELLETGLKKTFIGVDNAAISITYRFDINK